MASFVIALMMILPSSTSSHDLERATAQGVQAEYSPSSGFSSSAQWGKASDEDSPEQGDKVSGEDSSEEGGKASAEDSSEEGGKVSGEDSSEEGGKASGEDSSEEGAKVSGEDSSEEGAKTSGEPSDNVGIGRDGASRTDIGSVDLDPDELAKFTLADGTVEFTAYPDSVDFPSSLKFMSVPLYPPLPPGHIALGTNFRMWMTRKPGILVSDVCFKTPIVAEFKLDERDSILAIRDGFYLALMYVDGSSWREDLEAGVGLTLSKATTHLKCPGTFVVALVPEGEAHPGSDGDGGHANICKRTEIPQPSPALGVPSPGHSFTGTVIVGDGAPQEPLVITAILDGFEAGSTSVTTSGSYTIVVYGPNATNPNSVTFLIGEFEADQHPVAERGGAKVVNLSRAACEPDDD